MQATGETVGKVEEEYRFALMADMHPFTIAERWTKIGRVEAGPRRVVQGRLRETWQVTEEARPLIRG